MKKTLLLSAFAIAFMVSYQAHAATASGKVTSVNGNNITVQAENGQQMTMATTDQTTYRKKKMHKKNKMKRGKRPAEWTYAPIAEEDDWVEVVYNPATGNGTVSEVQEVVVYDD
ncbi:MAG: hypothetical protein J6Y85_03170 [Alphaproteobacteria bacterium]|nr:hypothetical protein [Alphaproteobacteria bacterium]